MGTQWTSKMLSEGSHEESLVGPRAALLLSSFGFCCFLITGPRFQQHIVALIKGNEGSLVPGTCDPVAKAPQCPPHISRTYACGPGDPNANRVLKGRGDPRCGMGCFPPKSRQQRSKASLTLFRAGGPPRLLRTWRGGDGASGTRTPPHRHRTGIPGWGLQGAAGQTPRRTPRRRVRSQSVTKGNGNRPPPSRHTSLSSFAPPHPLRSAPSRPSGPAPRPARAEEAHQTPEKRFHPGAWPGKAWGVAYDDRGWEGPTPGPWTSGGSGRPRPRPKDAPFWKRGGSVASHSRWRRKDGLKQFHSKDSDL